MDVNRTPDPHDHEFDDQDQRPDPAKDPEPRSPGQEGAPPDQTDEFRGLDEVGPVQKASRPPEPGEPPKPPPKRVADEEAEEDDEGWIDGDLEDASSADEFESGGLEGLLPPPGSIGTLEADLAGYEVVVGLPDASPLAKRVVSGLRRAIHAEHFEAWMAELAMASTLFKAARYRYTATAIDELIHWVRGGLNRSLGSRASEANIVEHISKRAIVPAEFVGELKKRC